MGLRLGCFYVGLPMGLLVVPWYGSCYGSWARLGLRYRSSGGLGGWAWLENGNGIR